MVGDAIQKMPLSSTERARYLLAFCALCLDRRGLGERRGLGGRGGISSEEGRQKKWIRYRMVLFTCTLYDIWSASVFWVEIRWISRGSWDSLGVATGPLLSEPWRTARRGLA